MRKITLVIGLCLTLFYSQSIFGQDTVYDTDMFDLAYKTILKIKEENKLIVAVWFFHNTKGAKTELGDYVGRDFSIYFTNIAKKLQVVDRDHIEQLSNEHQWNEEGFIDPATAKEVNKLVAADAIVTGTVDYTLHHLRVRIKIIDTQTGKQIGAAIKTVRLDEGLKYILKEEHENRRTHKTGKRRVLVVENENDPRLTQEECEKSNIGDYCFQNNTKDVMAVSIRGTIVTEDSRFTVRKELKIAPYKNGCLFGMKAGVYDFIIYKNKVHWQTEQLKGTIRIEKCKSLTYHLD